MDFNKMIKENTKKYELNLFNKRAEELADDLNACRNFQDIIERALERGDVHIPDTSYYYVKIRRLGETFFKDRLITKTGLQKFLKHYKRKQKQMEHIRKIGIRNFVKEIDKDIKVKFQEWDMECDIFEETIYIGKQYDEENDRRYKEFIGELDSHCRAPVFLLSILHEIGHIMTYEDEEKLDEKDLLYAAIQLKMDAGEDMDECVAEYFRIPLEMEATQWAINFANDNPKLIDSYKWLSK